MNRKQELLFKGALLKWIREWFEQEGIPECRYNQFSFAGSCENAPTTFWIDKMEENFMLPQTRQIMAEVDLIMHGLDAVYMMQTSYRDEPRAGDGRHVNQFLLTEMEHKNMSQDELINHEIRMLDFMITKALEYFKEHPEITTKQNIERLDYALKQDIPIVTYTDMIDKLNEKGVSINWGDDFSSVAEEFICGMFAKMPLPVVVKNYPEKLKYFNMYVKRDSEPTDKVVVECADLLLPFAGETWGSSRRENEYERIKKRFYEGTMYKQLKERLMEKVGYIEGGEFMDKDAREKKAEEIIHKAFNPYFELFKGKIHDRAGYGLGTSRLCQFLLGMNTVPDL